MYGDASAAERTQRKSVSREGGIPYNRIRAEKINSRARRKADTRGGILYNRTVHHFQRCLQDDQGTLGVVVEGGLCNESRSTANDKAASMGNERSDISGEATLRDVYCAVLRVESATI
jgi:hypothetical protein